MANSATVYARIDPNLKNDVQVILDTLGITPSQLIQMLYSQIKLKKKIPFDIEIPERPKYYEEYTPEELKASLDKALKDVEEGRVYTWEEVEKRLKKELDL